VAYRYLGNKTRLLDWLTDIISERVPYGARIADPMCGTAAVSEALARRGYSVAASDFLTFPVLHAKARLLFGEEPGFERLGGYARAIEHLNSLTPVRGYFYREFSPAGSPAYGGSPRGYFTTDNAMRIDAVRAEAKRLLDAEDVTRGEHDLLLHDLALAVNDVANITGTYGYFRATWNDQSLVPLKLVREEFEPTSGDHAVMQADAADALSVFVGEAVYLDPPYTKRQYSGNYHVIETIAMGDEPFANGAGGLRDWRHQASDFCYRKKAPGAFRQILDAAAGVRQFFISYSEDGQVAPDDLFAVLSEYGKVERFDLEISRFRSNSHVVGGGVTEHLYHVARDS
jgi:adenine-specific DNA-methyltransferase